ncbi:hypothetical protein KP509_21G066100 [Ceratopteris richardii]|uniref:isochorismate synthase n=1 Tax=Ceratopteris richardii TaxID=49495 RepID=A0A8T2SEF1_CERRI|nr:hypothetical protein KP509_21G066100 [Ceratopteris richardii]
MELSVANVATAPIPPGATLLRRGRAAVCNLSPLPASSLHGSSSSSSFGGFCLRPRCSRLQSFCYASSVVSLQQMIEDSSDTVEGPVLVCETRTLQPVLSLANAREALISALGTLQSNAYLIPSGIVRLQVAFSVEVKALEWLQCQPHNEQLLPRIYFSPRQECGTYGQDVDGLKHVAGIGSALLVKGQKPFTLADLKYVKRFLSRDCPLIRAYGAIRFDADIEPSEEWKEFGVFLFTIPLVELCESSGYPILAVTVAWDGTLGRDFKDALSAAKGALFQVSDFVATKNMNPCVTNLSKEHTPSEQAWHGLIKDVLQILDSHENLEAASQEIDIKHAIYDLVGLSKVVLARRTKLVVDPAVEPLTLVSLLQEKNPNSYQFCIQLSNSSFIGSTPERLFYKVGTKIFSEAIAGTRACGITENKDRDLGLELLSSAKDHLEFNIVMESIKQKLEGICKNVKVDCYKDLIKQANIQHLYGSLVGELCDGISEFELLSELHPTPAVCGQPQKLAKRFLNKIEQFDRGMYSGPIGWISGERAEFVVAIRSALLENPPNLAAYNGASVVTQLFLFAGVGIVKGSEPSSEWKELDLKIQPFEGILQPISPLHDASNINALWSRLIIEECCRLGIVYFCIAPGSRSSPLAVAAAENFKAKCVSCVDERSLAFHALGYARGASKPAAVITTSGTAVSNLLPAVVEASEGCVPLVLLTADRPPELLQAGANQSIDQIKHFGSFVRYNTNLPPPSDEMQARVVVTTVDAAIFYATSSPKGPVHINISFREPLAGTVLSWSHSCLKGLERWALSSQPFTKYMTPTSEIIRQHQFLCTAMKEMSDLIDSASRGLILTGGLQRIEESRAVLLLAKHLGWPVVPDILSGIRIRHSSLIDEDEVPCVIDHFDHILLDEDIYESIKPDTVLQDFMKRLCKMLKNN